MQGGQSPGDLRVVSGKNEKSGKMYCCLWSITVSIVLVTEFIHERSSLLGKAVQQIVSKEEKGFSYIFIRVYI